MKYRRAVGIVANLLEEGRAAVLFEEEEESRRCGKEVENAVVVTGRMRVTHVKGKK